MDRLREQLVSQLTEEHAHTSFQDAVDGLDHEYLGVRTSSLPYSIWELTEHIRIAQADIVEFCINPNYQALNWPEDYWPSHSAPADQDQWQQTLAAIEKDRQQMVEIVTDPDNDLLEPLPHGDGQTLFREAILIVDHTSYHTGQIVTVLRLLGQW